MRTLAELRTIPVGEMTREEQFLVMTEACRKLAANLESNAEGIRAILQATAAPCNCGSKWNVVHASTCPQNPNYEAK